MVKVFAREKGYFGGIIREAGARFTIPDDVWDDAARRPRWCEPAAFGGKGDHDGDGRTGGSEPEGGPKGSGDGLGEGEGGGTVQVPADWQNGTAAERKALAKAITGKAVPNAREADEVISAYVEANKPEPFADAPEPEAVQPAGNGVKEALGVDPDWVAPDSDAPQPVTD